MLTFIIRRLLLMIPVVFGATILLFSILMMFSPERRAAVYINTPQQAKDLPRLVKLYGLDDPFYLQYGRWLKRILQGDFGYSTTGANNFWPALLQRLPVTLELTLYTVPILIIFGIWLGTISGIYHDKFIDHAARFGAILFWSLPNFLFALVLLMVFYGYLHLFPPGVISDEIYRFILDNPDKYTRYTHLYTIDGLLNGRLDITLDAFKRLAMPVISLVLVIMALFVRLMRATMIEEISKDYIITGLAKGADKKTVYYKHARKNALIPIVTVSGTLIAFLIQGTVMEEVVFNRLGLGMWLANAAVQLDIPALMGIVILTSTLMVFTNLAVDVLCAYIDPRIRLD